MLPRDTIFDVLSLNFVTYVVNYVANISYVCCPTPHGVGGLKLLYRPTASGSARPTPHGVGGLKSTSLVDKCSDALSHPSRGGWIEMPCVERAWERYNVPPLPGWVV